MDFLNWFNGLVIGLAFGVIICIPLLVRLKLYIKKLNDIKMLKALCFVRHIENHLKNDEEFRGLDNGKEVMCKICDKTIDEIYEEALKKVN